MLKDGSLTSSFCSVGEGPIVQPWPKRMFAPSPRLKELNINEKKYLIDTVSYSLPFLNKQVLKYCGVSWSLVHSIKYIYII